VELLSDRTACAGRDRPMYRKLERAVNSSYMKYLTFLKGKEDGANMSTDEIRMMKYIVKHASYWRGGNFAPKKEYVIDVLRCRGSTFDVNANKYELLKELIRNLRNAINEHQTRPWEAPVPITEAAKHLFTFTNHVVYAPIAPGTARTTAPPPVVGTRRFKNYLEFQTFLELGQHPTKASPCVCVQAVDWKHPMVYEEWTKHHETKAGEDILRIF